MIIVFSGCTKQPEKARDLPAGFISQLNKASVSDDIFELSRTIPLRTPDSVFVGDITYLYITSDRRFITLDMANRMPLVFDKTGGFIFRIGKVGEGPGEFKRASAVCYDSLASLWYIADNSRMKILVFRDIGEYVREFGIQAKVYELQVGMRGELYLFMPNKRDGNMVECLKPINGEHIASFLSSSIIAKIPFVIYGGGLCITRNGVFAAHYLSSDLCSFDELGKLKFKVYLRDFDSYIAPSFSEELHNIPEFFSSFTGISRILHAPFDLILVQYQKDEVSKENKRRLSPTIYIALVTGRGEVLCSGINTSVGYFASDTDGDLYSIEYPEPSNSQQDNPVINQWTLKKF
jgi:hypothetical protein